MQQALSIRLWSESRGERSLEGDQGRRSSPGFRGTDRESKATRRAGIERQRSPRAPLHGDDMELGQRDWMTQGLRAGGSARGLAASTVRVVVACGTARSLTARVREFREGGIVIGSPCGDPIIPKLRFGTALRASQNACVLVEPVGSNRHPYPPNKRPLDGGLLFGGEGGIRTHVPGFPDHLISSQRRCDRFGTSPADRDCNTAILLVRSTFEERG